MKQRCTTRCTICSDSVPSMAKTPELASLTDGEFEMWIPLDESAWGGTESVATLLLQSVRDAQRY